MQSIIVRHGERPSFSSELGVEEIHPPENDVSLTKKGFKQSRRFGEQLGKSICCVYSSPVRRCLQTASSIVAGAGLLNSPVEKAFLSSEHFGIPRQSNERQKHKAISSLLAGKKQKGFTDPKIQSAYALGALSGLSSNGFTVFVTHDWWMAVLLSNITDAFYKYKFDIWPNFLENFIINHDEKYVEYRKEIYKIKY